MTPSAVGGGGGEGHISTFEIEQSGSEGRFLCSIGDLDEFINRDCTDKLAENGFR